MESPGQCIPATPAKSATMKRTLVSVFTSEGTPAFNSLVDVPVALLTPLPDKSVISFANRSIISPLAPITPDKGQSVQNCNSNEVYHLVIEDLNNKSISETTEMCEERLTNGNMQSHLSKKVPSSQVNSTRCMDNEGSEDEETQEIDLNKTPRKKVVARKKHRPKVIQEGKSIKSPRPVTPKTVEKKEMPILRRTYVRRNKDLNSLGSSSGVFKGNKELVPVRTYVRKKKGLNSLESPSGRIGVTTNACGLSGTKTVDHLPKNASKSVRRSLDFSLECEVSNEQHVPTVSDVDHRVPTASDVEPAASGKTVNAAATEASQGLTLELIQGQEMVVTKSAAGVAFDLNRSLNEMLDEYLSLPENPISSVQSSRLKFVRDHLMGCESIKDAGNDLSMLSYKEQSYSGSHSDIITRENDVGKSGTKRNHDHVIVHQLAKESPSNIWFEQRYDEAKPDSMSQETICLSSYLPLVYKKRRTQRGHTMRCKIASLPKLSRCFTVADAQCSASSDILLHSELLLSLDQTTRVTRKRSKLPTRARMPLPIAGAERCSHQLLSAERTGDASVWRENKNYGPQVCMEALFADTRFKITTKKPRTKGHVHLSNSMLSGVEEEHEVSPRKCSLLGQHFVPQAVMPYMDPWEFIIEKMKHMKISGDQIKAIGEPKNALIPYGGRNMVISYRQLFDTIKKQRLRAKVDLDPETNRVWNLLMGKKSNDEADGVDLDKEKWWEEERCIFRGRADAFIARMHLVQGDRRFSKWNGSVVDSVVGVFLTQNVSDHLSSSAFMSLASRFPIRTSGNNKETNANKKNTSDIHGDRCIPAFDDTINCQEKMLVPIEITPGTPGAYKREKEAPDASSLHVNVVLQLHDEKSFEVQMKSRETDFPVDNSYQEVEILSEQHYGSQIEYFGPCDEVEILETIEAPGFNLNYETYNSKQEQPERKSSTLKPKKVNAETRKRKLFWENLRKEAFDNGANSERSRETMDSLDWEAVRNAAVDEISKVIRERGMNNVLAQRIKDFLDRLVEDHGCIDLEWLRHVSPDKAKEYLLSIRGLGIKSVECVRLLTLHHLAFPVDTNVGRVCVRLGWVPLQPLPESLQLHLLELYPMIEHIQKYLWPRLCTLDQQTLYELHYQMITFGKVFCTKTKPNCNACPMRGECKHFASAFASARLSLPGPQEKRLVLSRIPSTPEKERSQLFRSVPLLHLEGIQPVEGSNSEPIVEEPASPEHECAQTLESDIEDAFYEDPEEIPTINLSSEDFKKSLMNYMKENEIQIEDEVMSKALVEITADAAFIPVPKLKNVSRLRTEHLVYELPDSHCLLEGMDQRVPGDPSPYLLAIWIPGETSQSFEPPQSCCVSQDSGKLCYKETCFACNSMREAQAQTVRGTILIPCRTAMKGGFPLNGTYFQVNEVFADHSSSRVPIDVPREWIWNLPRRTVFFGTSVTTIFRGLTMEGIQQCFWRGFVCVRGFDRAQRAPRPLYARLHFPPSKAVEIKKTPAKDKRSS